MARATDISIDLETLGRRWDAPIISIGAAAFERHSGKIGPTYYAEINLDDALRYGRPDGDTLAWWMQQDQAARRLFIVGGDKRTMYEALRGLGDFVRAQQANVCVWGNGATFDITLLERHYDVAGNGLMEQWQFWGIRDMRTSVDMAGLNNETIKFEGVPHNALDDAIHQAKIIAACFKKLGLGAPTVDEDDEL